MGWPVPLTHMSFICDLLLFSYQYSQAQARTMMDFASTGKGKMLKVQSCFGGLAIYKYDVMKGCKYGYRYDQPPYMLDCEHVLLHKCMTEKNQARIFSNSKMYVLSTLLFDAALPHRLLVIF